MSAFGEKLRAQFGLQTLRIVVPEWKGLLPEDSQKEPAIYAKPFTLADQKGMRKYIEATDDEGLLWLIVRKATDEDGNLLFDAQDKLIMRQNCDFAVIQRIGLELIGQPDMDEDAAGNSEATPSLKPGSGSPPNLASV